MRRLALAKDVNYEFGGANIRRRNGEYEFWLCGVGKNRLDIILPKFWLVDEIGEVVNPLRIIPEKNADKIFGFNFNSTEVALSFGEFKDGKFRLTDPLIASDVLVRSWWRRASRPNWQRRYLDKTGCTKQYAEWKGVRYFDKSKLEEDSEISVHPDGLGLNEPGKIWGVDVIVMTLDFPGAEKLRQTYAKKRADFEKKAEQNFLTQKRVI